ncbi:MAG TPA: hypothetical protein VH144_01035 [Candidatus Saccharimonadales bacterium]|nr:hypothetical protein [Candidatus Saccharimonadales bacterium]
MRQKIIYITIMVVIVVGVTVTLRQLILGGKDVTTSDKNATDTQILQSINGGSTCGGPETLNISNVYTVDNKKYFDNNAWLVAHITPKDPGTAESAYVVMRGTNNIYSVVVGPGSDFPRDSLVDVPTDVVNYLDSLGFVSDPTE